MEPTAHALLLRRYGADASQDERVAFLVDHLLEMEQVHEWKRAVEQEIRKPEYSLDALQSGRGVDAQAPLYRVLDKLGLVSALKRVVVDVHCECTRTVQAASQQSAQQEEATLMPELLHATTGNTLNVVAKARESWEKITREELLRFASEHSKPLISLLQNPLRASASTPTEPQKSGKASSTSETEAEDAVLPATNPEPARSYRPPASTRFLYDGNDLLRSLQAIKPANRSAEALASSSLQAWGSIQLQLHTSSMQELRRLFAELGPGYGQIGVDELFPVERLAFLAEKHRVGDLVRGHHPQSVSMARQYAKTGCPTSLRSQIWRQALGITTVSTETRQHFQQLQDQVAAWSYVTDDMYLLDLQRAIDSSDYFVFQDHLDRVVLAFTRDATVLERALQVNGAVQLSPQDRRVITGSDSNSEGSPPVSPSLQPPNDFVPPNGVLPFSGLVLYVAPLTYVYQDEVELYVVFREMYVRYWSRLNALRTEKATILPLCKLFESLVARSSPIAVLHLLSVGIQPLDIVFPWLQSAFSGVLEIQQLLLLWDRVVGYDSLELLAVFAAALFHFRAQAFHSVTTMDDVRALYAELLEIQAIPLLQEYLFLLT